VSRFGSAARPVDHLTRGGAEGRKQRAAFGLIARPRLCASGISANQFWFDPARAGCRAGEENQPRSFFLPEKISLGRGEQRGAQSGYIR